MTDTENTLTLETTKGKVVIQMRPDLAPKHVARIKELVRDGFYDGIVFHRVIDGFMAQTGCPNGTGTGGSCGSSDGCGTPSCPAGIMACGAGGVDPLQCPSGTVCANGCCLPRVQ